MLTIGEESYDLRESNVNSRLNNQRIVVPLINVCINDVFLHDSISSLIMLTNEQIEASKTWIQSFYECLGSATNDINVWLKEFCQPDAILIHGSQPPLKGYEEISKHLEEARNQHSIQHVIKQIDVLPNRIYVEVDGIFTPKIDPEHKEILIHGLAVFEKKIHESKSSSMIIYLDPTPLIQRMKTLFQS